MFPLARLTPLYGELEAERRDLQDTYPLNLKHIWLECPAALPVSHDSVSLPPS